MLLKLDIPFERHRC